MYRVTFLFVNCYQGFVKPSMCWHTETDTVPVWAFIGSLPAYIITNIDPSVICTIEIVYNRQQKNEENAYDVDKRYSSLQKHTKSPLQ